MPRRTPGCGALPLILLLLAPGPAMAATYCVATNGNDANPGTESQPWKTLQEAVASVQAGDTVRIKAGEYDLDWCGHAEMPGEVYLDPDTW